MTAADHTAGRAMLTEADLLDPDFMEDDFGFSAEILDSLARRIPPTAPEGEVKGKSMPEGTAHAPLSHIDHFACGRRFAQRLSGEASG